MSKKGIVGLTFLAFVIAVGASYCHAEIHLQEHPQEHPTKKEVKITKDSLAEVIEEYVKKDAELRGGYFLVYDKKAKMTLALKLVRVHKDRLSMVEKDVYFACADFKTTEGKLYDLDIFMKGNEKDNLKVTEISIHKEEGNPRYTWHEDGGVWKKKPVKD